MSQTRTNHLRNSVVIALSVLAMVTTLALIMPPRVHAAPTTPAAPATTQKADTKKGCEGAGAGEPCLTTESSVFNTVSEGSLQGVIGNVIKYITGLVGVLALAMFIYGGLMWMLAGGNQEKITKAKNTLVWSVLGLVMVFGAYTLVKFVLQAAGA